jgi:hypothetical protein
MAVDISIAVYLYVTPCSYVTGTSVSTEITSSIFTAAEGLSQTLPTLYTSN